MSSPATKTIAMVKLTALLTAAVNVSTFARSLGMQAHTVLLLATGSTRPQASTMAKLVAVGIEPQDWFRSATTAADDTAVTSLTTSAASRSLPLAFSPSTPSASNG